MSGADQVETSGNRREGCTSIVCPKVCLCEFDVDEDEIAAVRAVDLDLKVASQAKVVDSVGEVLLGEVQHAEVEIAAREIGAVRIAARAQYCYGRFEVDLRLSEVPCI